MLLYPSSLFVLLLAVTSCLAHSWNATCTAKSQRQAWHKMDIDEKLDYIDAERCLMSSGALSGIKGALNIWDELHWAHINNTAVVHFVGTFLPWHRYYVRVHEYLLQSQCDYVGGQPYWDEPLDAGNMTLSTIFDPETGFGGQGSTCVEDGPFVDLRLHFTTNSTSADYCLKRQFSQRAFQAANQSIIDRCLTYTTFVEAWNCIEGSPHGAGHGGVGGLMVDVALSPADPIFYLHHAYLDRAWWQWQQMDLETRLVEIGGSNIPSIGGGFPGGPGGPGGSLPSNATAAEIGLFEFLMDHPLDEKLARDGDPGNVTTLNHVLNMVGIVPNATIADVMDLRNNINCAEYI